MPKSVRQPNYAYQREFKEFLQHVREFLRVRADIEAEDFNKDRRTALELQEDLVVEAAADAFTRVLDAYLGKR